MGNACRRPLDVFVLHDDIFCEPVANIVQFRKLLRVRAF